MSNDELSNLEKMRLGVTNGESRTVMTNNMVDEKALKKPYEKIDGANQEQQQFLRKHRIDG